MKKILLFSTIAISSVLTNAQIISDDNFNSSDFTVGHLSEGRFPNLGQKDWQIFSTSPSLNLDDFKIEMIGSRKVAIVTGLTTSTPDIGYSNSLSKSSFVSGWKNRTQSNNVLNVEFEIYTGTANPNTENSSNYSITAFNPQQTGFTSLNSFTINHKDLTIGLNYYSNICNVVPSQCSNDPTKDIDSWSYTLENPVPANKWIKVGLSYNYNTAEIFYKILDSETGDVIEDIQLPGIITNSDFTDIGLLAYSGMNSKEAAKSILGSFKVYASDKSNLLAINDFTKTKVNLSLFPNPVTDFLNIDTKSKIESVQVYDISGKIIKSSVLDNKVDVRNLSKGTYIIKVKTIEGETTQKFIKK